LTGGGGDSRRTLDVVLLCDDEPFEIPGAVERIVESLPEWRFTVVSLPGHAAFSGAGTNISRYVGLYGVAGFFVRGIQMVILKALAAVGAPTSRPHSLRQAASRARAAYARIDRINSKEGRDALAGMHPDVVVSIACPQILSPRTLAIPSICSLNLHSALLPNNRGMLPTFWSLFSDPPKAGVTLHFMDAGLDSGEILLRREIPVSREGTSLHSLIREAKSVGAGMVVEGLLIISRGGFSTIPNPPDAGSRNGFPSRRDVAVFRRKGGRIW
jgi:folate-dependent phosphoribosylglycinamide formyltransferase PurN